MAANTTKAILDIGSISFPMKTQNPFLFAVYHRDYYPQGNAKMEAPRLGNGQDFNPDADYRMYHGRTVPGFPQHPHRGFETLTCTMEGLVDHSDSLHCGGRYGNGVLQWMTAGKGIVHGEMFPLVNENSDNPLRLFQIWLNLPKASKMANPNQIMHWSENIPHYQKDKVDVTIWAGKFGDKVGLEPPKDSWARDPEHDVGAFLIKLEAGGSVQLPKTKDKTNRSIYYFQWEWKKRSSEPDSVLGINSETIRVGQYATLKPNTEIELVNLGKTEIFTLVLQGQPIDEPVVQHGPFVMNSRQEILEAFSDYQKTQFGGWPWDQEAVVFPREKGRFLDLNGKVELPPSAHKSQEK